MVVGFPDWLLRKEKSAGCGNLWHVSIKTGYHHPRESTDWEERWFGLLFFLKTSLILLSWQVSNIRLNASSRNTSLFPTWSSPTSLFFHRVISLGTPFPQSVLCRPCICLLSFFAATTGMTRLCVQGPLYVDPQHLISCYSCTFSNSEELLNGNVY